MKIFLFSLILFGISATQLFGEVPYNQVDGTNLKFAYNDHGIRLVNQTSCDVKEVKLQTYPISSNALDRILGRGSYYFSRKMLKRGDSVGIRFSEFSNKEGQYLDRKKYAFKRVSISVRNTCGEERVISEHFNLDI